MRSCANNLKLILVVVVSTMLWSGTAAAVSPESIFVDIVPEFPAPYEQTTISLRSFAANLDIVSISWTVNGKSVLSGIGKKSYTVTVGAGGSETKVTASVFLPDGQIIKTIVLRPSALTLLWQANDSYVPPFYRGKAMPAPGSRIKVVAMPEGTLGKNNMTYTWEKDYSADLEASGYAKNYYIFTHDYLSSDNRVSVEAIKLDQTYASSANVNFITTEPEIVFYKQDPEMGIQWENALTDNYVMPGPTVVVASPYFISPKDLWRPELAWQWYINDTPVTVPTFTKNVMPLQIEAGSSGLSKLRLDLENTFKFLPGVSKEITIQF